MITDHVLEGSPMKRKQPVALVTGASSGIGKATAERLATAGYKLYGTSRRRATPDRRPFEMLSLDVTSDESVEAAVHALLRSEGRVDLLVNNAGFGVAPAGAEAARLGAESHCAALARAALLDAIREYSNAARDDWAGDEALICTCFFVSERTIDREIQTGRSEER